MFNFIWAFQIILTFFLSKPLCWFTIFDEILLFPLIKTVPRIKIREKLGNEKKRRNYDTNAIYTINNVPLF